MGKSIKSVVSATPLGRISPAGGLVSALDIFKGGGGPGPRLDTDIFQRQKEVDERTKQAREASLGLIADLQKQAKGEAPSLAEATLKSATSRNLAQTLAAAAAQRGGSPALAQRNILMAKSAGDREIAEKGALARMQEQQAAQDRLASLTQGQQSQDIAQIMQPAGLAAQGEQSRFEADVARRNAVKAQQNAMMGQLLSAGSTLGAAAMSDEQQKKDVKPTESKIKSFLDALAAREFEYKDTSKPGTAPGKRYGIMAQDLEKSEMGKSLVRETPVGKMVDTVQGFGAVLAAQAEMNKRLKKLEKGK